MDDVGRYNFRQLEGLDAKKDTPNSAYSKSDWLKNMSINNIVAISVNSEGILSGF